MSRLRAERERLGLTQEATRAILWGMPHRTFQDIESERRQPPEWVMLAILEKLSKRKSLAGQGEKTPDSKRRAKSNALQQAKITAELVFLAASSIARDEGKEPPQMPERIVEVPDELEWIDDGKCEIKTTLTGFAEGESLVCQTTLTTPPHAKRHP